MEIMEKKRKKIKEEMEIKKEENISFTYYDI
jgi:hypothetical protein